MPARPARFLALLFAIAAVAVAWPSTASAQNPFDALQRERAARVTKAGRSARGAIPLLEMWQGWDLATPSVTTELLDRLAHERRLPADRRSMAAALLARARLRNGDVATFRTEWDALGFITPYRVIGPFDNEGKRGFEAALGPEAVLATTFDPQASYDGRERPVQWRTYPDLARIGYVSFDDLFVPNENVCAFAETYVISERAQPLTIWAGAGGAIKIWWNGTQVLEDNHYRQPDIDRSVALVGAHQGVNRMLVKVCVAESTWGFLLRVGDAEGGPPTGLRFDASLTDAGPTGALTLRLPAAPIAPLASLEAAAAPTNANAQALEDLARYLALTGSDDPAERRARDLASRAADADPNVERLRLAAELADERGEVMRFAARAQTLAPNDPDVLMLLARLRQSGPAPEDALPILERVPPRSRQQVEAALMRAEIQMSFEFQEAAVATLEQLVRDTPGAVRLVQRLADAVETAGHADRAIEVRTAAVQLRYDDFASRRMLIADGLRRREPNTVVPHLEAFAAARPDSIRDALYVASVYEALGREDEAVATYVGARERAPEETSLIVAHARLLLRLDQTDAAADALRLAIDLRPQDADTRELLEQIRPQQRVDEAFAASSEELLARRSESHGFPLTTLADLTVNTVYDSGLGSSFHQIAAQIHDQEGARRFRTYGVQYDPDSQRVDIRAARVYRDGNVLEATSTYEQQLGEPWYRIYYDTRALTVVFPDLEPGDVVELRYRIDDVAPRNLFADYYGDLHVLQSDTPIAQLDYVLITPARRDFFFNEPRLRGLTHEQRVDGTRRIDHFSARNIAAIRTEDGMPGMTEVAPYLHVSTYRTWQEVGHWYWGLIRDQLQVDDGMRRTVRDLVRGAPDLRTKVQRIHNWVVRNTRYVGLEFGIHGFKPYRVPLIVQRGFGDCKDKASLLYTMMREAGIDARIVLVRTRRNGAITDLPASLSIFDHAIAYVPELDLYLDGTAEHSGTSELPNMDQGVTVLVVGPESAELRQSPVLPPQTNLRTRRIDIALDADGSASIEVQEEVRGGEAAHYRDVYQAEGTRADRLERSLRSLLPGLDLESQTMEHLDDLEHPVAIRYRATVPQMARSDGGNLVLTPSVMTELVRSLARTATRTQPLDLGSTSAYTEDRTVTLPQGMHGTDVPPGGEVESEFGRLKLTIEASGRTIRSHTEFELRRDRIPAAEYPAFRAWVERADVLLRQRIGVERGGAR